jgi:PIN domain nuclease of toxin-antitoxin system
MRLLIDTHVFIWALTDPKKLSAVARAAITSVENELHVSAVSFWEIAIKLRSGRLAPIGHEPYSLVEAAESMGFIPIELTPVEAATQGNLTEDTHFDPFDRMLIWQAIERSLTLVSGDRKFERFASDGLKLLWA